MIAITVVVGTVGAGVAGVVALAIGVIGRRVDDHPTCRACGFDLIGRGSTPGAVLGAPCPECGKQVATETNVRVGTRVRRRGALTAGMFLLSLAILIAMPFVVVPLAGNTSAKPTWLLLVEAEYGTTSLQEPAADELMNRHVAGNLAAADGLKLVELAARVHANPNAAFTKVWREILGDEVLFAMLPAATRDAAAVRGVEPFLKVRSRVKSGKSVEVPFGIVLPGNERVLRPSERTFAIRTLRWRVEDSSGRAVGQGEFAWPKDLYMLTVTDATGSASWSTRLAACDLVPGRYSMVVDVESVVAPTPLVSAWPKPPLPDGPVVKRSMRGEFEALLEGERSVEVVGHADALRRLREAIKVGKDMVPNRGPTMGQVRQPGQGRGEALIPFELEWTKHWNPGELPVGLETSWHASLWTIDGSSRVEGVEQLYGPQFSLYAGSMGDSVRFSVSKRVPPGKYLLRVKTDPEAMEKQTDGFKVLQGEMEFEVELEEWPKPKQ